MSRLANFLFKGEVGEAISVRRVRVETEGGKEKEEPPPKLQFRLVMFLSWILGATLILCLLFVFFLVMSEREIPGFIPPLISAIVGYFGGAISAYVGIGAE